MGITKAPRPPVAADFGIIPSGFTVHPDSNTKELTVQFAVPLFTKQMSLFYETMYRNTFYYYSNVMLGALVMYNKFMILSIKNPDLFLVPPFEVTLCWYSHMTRPLKYQQYCKQMIDKYGAKEHAALFASRYNIVPAHLYLNEMHMALLPEAWQQTLDLWQTEFKEPMFPSQFVMPKLQHHTNWFSLDSEYFSYSDHAFLGVRITEGEVQEKALLAHYAKLYKSNVEMNITGKDVENDIYFFDKLTKALPSYTVIYEYDIILKSYERFLFFLTKVPNAAPSLFIDLAWHTHMANPIAYIHDTCKLLGKVVDHDPSYAPTKSEEMNVKQKWQQEFNTELAKDHTYFIS